MEIENKIIGELVFLLRKGNAHVSLDRALEGICEDKLNIRPDSLPYSIWELTEHLRIAQHDIVEFCKSADYQSPEWPKDYWPGNKKVSLKKWNDCAKSIHDDREEMVDLLHKSKGHLFEPLEWGTGQSLFREALVIADHNSYHCGEIIAVRRLLGIWS